ncbi:PREDICTED: carbonic anhydrase-related protein 10-like [Diuraphis noxia]|uniref:carbonic anhydrase-related protein 10-like n=1 Tax=Diuraphis noxia TaxID=143948 RepID=UPI0007638B64|nr:PREDICTED: carbonic anhydrase-related protein 10-like [Diuraphis noxia]
MSSYQSPTYVRFGHSFLTHPFLISKDPPPTYDECLTKLSVQHVIIDCIKYRDIRNNLAIPPNTREEVPVKRLSVADLLPATHYYMTYDGSTTVPACHETVTWLILNKPIYITKQQLYSLRGLMQGSKKNQGMAPLGNNFRPPQPLHNRLVRTNIDFNLRKDDEKYCPSMHKDVYYKANDWKPH